MGRIYDSSMTMAWLTLKFIGVFNAKIKTFVQGRNKQETITNITSPIWFHCASVGEFEQARPLIENIKKNYPTQDILLTFFSPSGFNHLQDYPLADAVLYSPFDTRRQVRAFLKSYQPKSVILIKYEFWKNLISESSKLGIPIYSVSSIFRENQYFFRWYGKSYAKDLQKIKFFFVQNNESKKLLQKIGITQSTVTGDTRFDRVLDISNKSRELDISSDFLYENDKCIVAGSTWPKDEELILKALVKMSGDWKLLIAPHEVNEDRIESIMKLFSKYHVSRLSTSSASELKWNRIIVIDSIGLLNRLYKLGDICYVGGGFGDGVHNILEAAVWGKPVLFGPNHKKFTEAKELLNLGGGISFDSIEHGVARLLELKSDHSEIIRRGRVSKEYVFKNEGATRKTLRHLEDSGIFK